MSSRRDLQSRSIASPGGSAQAALIANNSNVIVVKGDRSRFAGKFTDSSTFRLAKPQTVLPSENRGQPNQQGTQAPFFPKLNQATQRLKTESDTRSKGNVLGQ